MHIRFFQFYSLLLLGSLFLLLFMASGASYGRAPAADAVLSVQAHASYKEGITGLARSVVSNLIRVKIAPVEYVTFSGNGAVLAQAGIRLVVPLRLHNAGNVTSQLSFSAVSVNDAAPAFSLSAPKLYRDVRQSGEFDPTAPLITDFNPSSPAGIGLTMEADETVALLMVAEVPADAVGNAALELIATTVRQQAQARIAIKAAIADSALLRLAMQAAPLWYAEDGVVKMTLNAKNIGAFAATGVSSVNSLPVIIDGQAQSVVLLRQNIPAEVAYVAASLVAENASIQRLYRYDSDPQFQYRTIKDGAGASAITSASGESTVSGSAVSGPRVAEIALAMHALGPHSAMQATFTLKVGPSAPDTLTLQSEGWAANTNAQSNPILLRRAITARPDIVPFIQFTDVGLGNGGEYILRVNNIGGAVTDKPMVLTTHLPDGIRAAKVDAGKQWQCEISSVSLLSCTTLQSLAENQFSTDIIVNVLVDETAFPAGENSVWLPGTVAVSGGGEPEANTTNNLLHFKNKATRGASLAGSVWMDRGHTGTYDSGDTLLAGWRVQLQTDRTAEVSAKITETATSLASVATYRGVVTSAPDPIVKEAVTDAQGHYSLTGIPAGGPYRLRFLAPGGARVGTPQDGVIGSPQANAERDQETGELVYARIEDNQNFSEQNLPVSYSGRVFDATTRKPVAQATVRIAIDGGGFDPASYLVGKPEKGTITTDAEGYFYYAFTPSAPAGNYTLSVEAAGYEPEFSRALPPLDTPMHLSATGQIPQVIRAAESAVIPVATAPVVYYNKIQREANASRLVNNLLAIDLVDVSAGDVLFLRKESDRREVELIDFLNYTLVLKYSGKVARKGFDIADQLPQGFSYVPGSARISTGDTENGAGVALEPETRGNLLRFVAADTVLQSDAPVRIQYRVSVGVNAREGVRAESRATAHSGNLSSNQASVSVNVIGGVFTSDAYVLGKVTLMCSDQDYAGGDGSADTANTMGVPGVRIYLEDGTFAETDQDGKYSIYGVKPLTHVLKLDNTTLPVSAIPLATTNRHAGRGENQFIDLRNGELGRGDFTLGCGAGTLADVQVRREKAAGNISEIETVIKRRFDVDPSTLDGNNTGGNLKSLPATGRIGGGAAKTTLSTLATLDKSAHNMTEGVSASSSALATAPASPSAPISRDSSHSVTTTLSDNVVRSLPEQQERPLQKIESGDVPVSIEAELRNMDAALDFVELKDAQITPTRQMRVRVKGSVTVGGAAAKAIRLQVNGEFIGLDRVGSRSELASRNIAVWEYIGVSLKAGKNDLTISQGEQQKSITITAPGDFQNLMIEVEGHAEADSKKPLRVRVHVTDANDIPVTAPTRITLSASAGQWLDAAGLAGDSVYKGIINDGVAAFDLIPPEQPGTLVLRAISGPIQASREIQLAASLRPMLATGIVEGVVSLRNGLIRPVGERDSFENELSRLSSTWDNGKITAGGRAAFFLKGKVKGEYLLTAAYDSEKDVKQRLFRDIQPERYYPVYGDSSVRGFDAQSTSRLYLRIDKGHSYLLYGDFSTQDATGVRQLTQYNRGVTGIKQHFQTDGGRVSGTFFASRDSLTQRVVEISPNGTSGPFSVFGADYLENSERIEIITRDRNMPTRILATRVLSRFADYEIETMSGTLLFKSPEPSTDANFNPNTIRVTYESDGNGAKFWLYGGDMQVRVTDAIKLGAVAIEDRNPVDPRALRGLTLEADLGRGTSLVGELAQTDTAKGLGRGSRVELKHQSAALKAGITAVQVDGDFDNLNSPTSGGQIEARAGAEYKLDERNTLKAELVHARTLAKTGNASGSGSTNVSPDTKLEGALIGIEHAFDSGIRAEIGTRMVRGTAQGVNADGDMDTDDLNLNTLRMRLGTRVPGVPNASVYTEYERDMRDADKRLLAFGGEYQIKPGTKVYGRHEALSSLGNIYELGDNQKTSNYRTVIGVETEYMPQASLFNEYRLGSAIDGRDAQNAFGLRNGWNVASGLRLNTTFERTKALSGSNTDEATAVTGQVEYLANTRWKGGAGLELRRSALEDAMLNTLGLAFKLDHDWTFLGKSAVYMVTGRNGNSTNGVRARQRLGMAYRQTKRNKLNALAYYEHRVENGRLAAIQATTRHVHLISSHASYRPYDALTVSARYAFKHVTETGHGQRSAMHGHLLSGRLARDITAKWDAGIAGSFFTSSLGERLHAIGVEAGYQASQDLWVSVGYNVFGFEDREFSQLANTSRGMYFRLRYKFDESSL
ncbi:carboxypeptidase regulatory-like domain-containing protein [Glaciimonas sp. GNP009]